MNTKSLPGAWRQDFTSSCMNTYKNILCVPDSCVIWWELIPIQHIKSVNLLIIKSACCHSFCTCFSSQELLIFQRQHCWSGVWVTQTSQLYPESQSVTHGITGKWLSLCVDQVQSKDVIYCTWTVLHGPTKILRNLQVKRMGTWHICLGGMLHLREIPRFSKKTQNTIPQAGIFSQILTHMVMNQNLTMHFRWGTNSCIRFMKEKLVAVPMWFQLQDYHWGTSLPQHRLTVTILMHGWTFTCGRRGRKELKRPLPPHQKEGGGPLWFPH